MAAKEIENNGNDGNGNAGDVMLVILMAEWLMMVMVMVMTFWTDQDPSLPAVMLNSHTDVVPGLSINISSSSTINMQMKFKLSSFPGALDLPTIFCS